MYFLFFLLSCVLSAGLIHLYEPFVKSYKILTTKPTEPNVICKNSYNVRVEIEDRDVAIAIAYS